MRALLAEIYRRDRVLAVTGWLHVALLAAMLLAMALDNRQVLGISVWIKPSKFAASIAIYLWTLAWLLVYVPGPAWCKGLIRWGASLAMIAEISCIAGQSLRGTASHFNHATPADDGVFTLMGLAILFNTMLEALVLLLFFQRRVALAPAYLWGIRLGLAGTLFSAAVGGIMLAHGGHTVGAPDGGPGLGLVNWSTTAGDLRIAHALGLHALQIVPLAGYGLSRVASARTSLRALAAVSLVYGVLAGWLLWQALQGQPLVSRL
jgi:hypothetical protein